MSWDNKLGDRETSTLSQPKTEMTSQRFAKCFIASQLVFGSVVHAQEVGDLFGAREPVRLLNELAVPDTGLKLFQQPSRAAAKYEFVLTPSFGAANGVNNYGGSLALATKFPKTELPIQFRYTHRVLDFAAIQRNRMQADVRITLTRPEAQFRFVTAAQYMSTSATSTRTDIQLGMEAGLKSGCKTNCFLLGASGSAISIDRVGGETRDGASAAVGLIFRPTQDSEISTDYRFESEVLGAEDFTISLRQRFAGVQGQPTLVLTGGRLRTLAVGTVFKF